MPKPYSSDFRRVVIEEVVEGASRREAAERFGISASVVVIWMQRFNRTGAVAALPSGGSISPLEKHKKFLLGLAARKPDMTLDEIVAVMRKRKIPGSRTALWRFYERHNITFKKKSLYASEQDLEEVARARRRWMRQQGLFDPAHLVFMDESWTNTSMVRLYGRCERGKRLVGHAPHGHWKTLTFVAGLRKSGMIAPFVIEGAIDGPMFLAYLKQCLAPQLKKGDIVVMDRLSVHEVAGVEEAIKAAGAKVRYLPTYSPDMNPMENAFAKVKSYLRKVAERTVSRLTRAISRAVGTVSADDCKNIFRHEGYVRT
jgi:transposase